MTVSPDQIFKIVHAKGFTLDQLRVNISEHFTWAEVFHSRTVQEVLEAPYEIFKNALWQAQRLERIRTYLGQKLGREAAMIVTSWYRSKQANEAAGGASTSSHLLGKATDWYVPGYEDEDGNRFIQALLIPFVFAVSFCLEITGGRWTHTDIRPLRSIFDTHNHVYTVEEQRAFTKEWGRGHV